MLHLERRRRASASTRHLVALGAGEDRGVGLAPLRLVELAQAAVAAADLVRLEPGERRVVAGELEQLGHQRAMRGDDGGADRGGLLRAAGQHDAGQASSRHS